VNGVARGITSEKCTGLQIGRTPGQRAGKGGSGTSISPRRRTGGDQAGCSGAKLYAGSDHAETGRSTAGTPRTSPGSSSCTPAPGRTVAASARRINPSRGLPPWRSCAQRMLVASTVEIMPSLGLPSQAYPGVARVRAALDLFRATRCDRSPSRSRLHSKWRFPFGGGRGWVYHQSRHFSLAWCVFMRFPGCVLRWDSRYGLRIDLKAVVARKYGSPGQRR